MTHKERAYKRLALAEELFKKCENKTAKEWDACVEQAWQEIE